MGDKERGNSDALARNDRQSGGVFGEQKLFARGAGIPRVGTEVAQAIETRPPRGFLITVQFCVK